MTIAFESTFKLNQIPRWTSFTYASCQPCSCFPHLISYEEKPIFLCTHMFIYIYIYTYVHAFYKYWLIRRQEAGGWPRSGQSKLSFAVLKPLKVQNGLAFLLVPLKFNLKRTPSAKTPVGLGASRLRVFFYTFATGVTSASLACCGLWRLGKRKQLLLVSVAMGATRSLV